MTTIVSTAPLPALIIKGLIESALAERQRTDIAVEVLTLPERTKQAVLELAPSADILLGDYTFEIPIDAEVVGRLEKCKLIQQPSAGYQQIDIEAARRKGIPVANTGGANDVSVAEHTVMVGLALLKSLFWADAHTRAGEWPQMAVGSVGCLELAGKTWGIVGFGRIGKEVARRLKSFGCQIIYYDVVPASQEIEEELGVSRCDLDQLLSRSDVVSLHVPLTPDTHHLIDASALSKLGKRGYLINVARGEVVDEEALVEALKNKVIKGAAIDVFAEEPPPPDHPLFSLENVIVTPHVAGVTDESRRRIMQVTASNIAAAILGETLRHVVN
ncbi:MAG: hydroxyacid dehydrogenase [Acidimicrobiia bacterium]